MEFMILTGAAMAIFFAPMYITANEMQPKKKEVVKNETAKKKKKGSGCGCGGK